MFGSTKKSDLEHNAQVMEDFRNNNIQILLATSIIETGVSIKNASIVAILDAERFGMSTLHVRNVLG